MVDSTTIRRACNRIFLAGFLGGFILWDLAHALGGIPALKLIIQLTQQGTTDPTGALSSANFKGDRK